MDWLKDFVNGFFVFLLEPLKWLLDGFLLIFSTFFYIIFDGFLFTVSGFFSLLDLSSIAFNQAATWSNLPPQLIYFVNQIGLPSCMTIVIGAISIRTLINLIPSWASRV